MLVYQRLDPFRSSEPTLKMAGELWNSGAQALQHRPSDPAPRFILRAQHAQTVLALWCSYDMAILLTISEPLFTNFHDFPMS